MNLKQIHILNACGVISAALIPLLTGCSKPEEPVPVAPPVRTFLLDRKTEPPFRRFPGEVAAAATSRMSFDVPGRIVQLPAEQGKVFQKGSLLARLDQTNYIARRDAARAQFKSANEEFNRRRLLLERGVISRSEFDQFQESFKVADANLRAAQRALDDTELLAPFDGRVAQRIVNNFQNVQAQEPALVFQNLATLDVDINVPEADMSFAGQGVTAASAREMIEAMVEFAALPGEQFPLELRSFEIQASQSTRTFRVTFELRPPENKNILPGMTCTALVRYRTSFAVADGPRGVYDLPVQAVSTDGAAASVWRIDPANMEVSRIPVEILAVRDGNLRVRAEDLMEGDELVSSGVRLLTEGMSVRRLPSTGPR